LGRSHKDTIYKSQKIKSGYTFALKRHDSIKYACLIKDGKETEVVDDEGDTDMDINALGYVYADFDKVFVLATHIGANPIEIQIVDKSTGGAVMYGASPIYTDTVKGIMLFDGNHRRSGKLILYDFNTGKSELFIEPRKTPCPCCFCWKFISLTDTELKVEYLNMKYEKVQKVYIRNSK
jgi:hypothetical protein